MYVTYLFSPQPASVITPLTRSHFKLLRTDDDTSPLLPLARWRTAPDAEFQYLEVFNDACTIPGLFDAFVLALVVLQSGQPLGDVPDCLNSASPKFFGTGDLMWR
jgi:hypothetical protein